MSLITYYHGHSSEVTEVVWSPNGRYIASAAIYRSVRVWEAYSGKDLCSYYILGDDNEPFDVFSLAWSPNGKQIVSGSTGSKRQIELHDANTGKLLSIYTRHSGWVMAVAWSPDGKYIASGGDGGTVHVWDAVSGHTTFIYKGHSKRVDTVTWSPNGKYIASGSEDKTIHVWDAATGHTTHIYNGHSDFIFSLAWSPDGKYIASGGKDKTVQVWNAISGEKICIYLDHSEIHNYNYRHYSSLIPITGNEGNILSIAWSPDSRYIATTAICDKLIRIWVANTGENKYIYSGHKSTVDEYSDNNVRAVSWSPQGILASGGDDMTVQIWQPF